MLTSGLQQTKRFSRFMYESLQLPWSAQPTQLESAYRSAGLVKTKGTLFLLPPSTQELKLAFDSLPKPKSKMSAGAVALCKHFERGGSSAEHRRMHPYWTLPTGSNENKSDIARNMLEVMLTQAVWRNVMLLHPGVAIYEVRNARGYGMRWTLDLEQVECHSPDVLEESRLVSEMARDESGRWRIVNIAFRGFVEPIAGMDNETEDYIDEDAQGD